MKTTRDLYKEKLLRWEEISFQDPFETACIRVTNVALFNIEGPATAKALSPFCILVGGKTRRVLSDAERVIGDVDLTFKPSVRYFGA